MQYSEDREWSDQFIPEIKQIIGPLLLCVTPDEIDMNEAADLMVFTAKSLTIAARMRRHGYAEEYPYDITFRSKRNSGSETELSKIINGFGDWFFYGHDGAGSIGLWWLIDLKAFRAALVRHKRAEGISLKNGEKTNKDGKTTFRWYDLRSFPKEPKLIIASSMELSK